MISQRIPDASVPVRMSLLADHPNLHFHYYRKGLGETGPEMHRRSLYRRIRHRETGQ